ncbi:MAG: prepilin-type N-terminal cleavage/methylation domain-containing protein [Phycisphaera sp.]|nr:prepilin-type N-terminal cleavage/methylation domain-containing protein [Phycisphaera sp.]
MIKYRRLAPPLSCLSGRAPTAEEKHVTPRHFLVRTHRRGFTLIELLVVVAIIALLIAILLPSLTKAKESARRAVCGANQHQIGIALTMYVNDEGGKYPPGNATITPGWGIDSTYGVPQKKPMGLGHLVPKYMPTAEALYCPSWKHPWNQYDEVDTEGADPWFGPSAMGGWPAPGHAGPKSHRGIAFHYRSSFGNAFNQPPNHNMPVSRVILADHWVRREVLYGVYYGHVDGYSAMSIDGSVRWVGIPAEEMESLMPASAGINNGKWALQETLVWRPYFDQLR